MSADFLGQEKRKQFAMFRARPKSIDINLASGNVEHYSSLIAHLMQDPVGGIRQYKLYSQLCNNLSWRLLPIQTNFPCAHSFVFTTNLSLLWGHSDVME